MFFIVNLNSIYNIDCIDFMNSNDFQANIILTSPPYNTSRKSKKDMYSGRYDEYVDTLSDSDYIDWTLNLFNCFDKVLSKDGVILYNLSYSSENPSLLYILLGRILECSNFKIADTIVWKKRNAIPNNRSSNKLTRICEFVFVMCRKDEIKSFQCNKEVKSIIESTGQKNYGNIYNFIESANNDGSCSLNKATFSSDFCKQLLNIYSFEDSIIYDPFMGTGTTAKACIDLNLRWLGTELSSGQITYAYDRLGLN